MLLTQVRLLGEVCFRLLFSAVCSAKINTGLQHRTFIIFFSTLNHNYDLKSTVLSDRLDICDNRYSWEFSEPKLSSYFFCRKLGCLENFAQYFDR